MTSGFITFILHSAHCIVLCFYIHLFNFIQRIYKMKSTAEHSIFYTAEQNLYTNFSGIYLHNRRNNYSQYNKQGANNATDFTIRMQRNIIFYNYAGYTKNYQAKYYE